MRQRTSENMVVALIGLLFLVSLWAAIVTALLFGPRF